MDLDAQAIQVRKLMDFQAKYESLLEELAKAKEAHEQQMAGAKEEPHVDD